MGDFGCFILSTGSSSFPKIEDEGIYPDALIVEGNAVSLVEDGQVLATAQYLATRPEFQTGSFLLVFMDGGIVASDINRLNEALPQWDLTMTRQFEADDSDPNYEDLGNIASADEHTFYVVSATKRTD